MKKISAFTIMEVIVVMILSAVVISLGYSVLRLIQDEFIMFHDRDNSLTNADQLDLTLSRDFERANQILFNKNSAELTFVDESRSVITYRLVDSLILRSSTKIDTFNTSAFSLKINNLDSLNFLPQILIDRLSFFIKISDKRLIRLGFHKQYPSQIFLDLNPLN